jgi:hypothetical protein
VKRGALFSPPPLFCSLSVSLLHGIETEQNLTTNRIDWFVVVRNPHTDCFMVRIVIGFGK